MAAFIHRNSDKAQCARPFLRVSTSERLLPKQKQRTSPEPLVCAPWFAAATMCEVAAANPSWLASSSGFFTSVRAASARSACGADARLCHAFCIACVLFLLPPIRIRIAMHTSQPVLLVLRGLSAQRMTWSTGTLTRQQLCRTTHRWRLKQSMHSDVTLQAAATVIGAHLVAHSCNS